MDRMRTLPIEGKSDVDIDETFWKFKNRKEKDPRISKVAGMDLVYSNIINSSAATQPFVQMHAKNE